MGFPIIQAVRRDGRVVECTGLENRQGFIAPLGFKSLSLHHYQISPLFAGFFVPHIRYIFFKTKHIQLKNTTIVSIYKLWLLVHA